MNAAALTALDRDGFIALPGVFSVEETERLCHDLEETLASASDRGDLLRSQSGAIYGARNVLRVFPQARQIWRKQPLIDLLRNTLGPGCGLVRGLFFDKPPTDSWSLPWHRDLTIAVKDNTLASELFKKPTSKAGLPHVEAPRSLLEEMLTLRIHLDDVTPDNGPLQVIAGSHRDTHDELAEDRISPHNIHAILVQRGDVLAMRPRILHSSIGCSPGIKQHRRILHLEFAATRQLPDGFEWAVFCALDEIA